MWRGVLKQDRWDSCDLGPVVRLSCPGARVVTLWNLPLSGPTAEILILQVVNVQNNLFITCPSPSVPSFFDFRSLDKGPHVF